MYKTLTSNLVLILALLDSASNYSDYIYSCRIIIFLLNSELVKDLEGSLMT